MKKLIIAIAILVMLSGCCLDKYNPGALVATSITAD